MLLSCVRCSLLSLVSIEDFLDSAVTRISSFAGVKYSEADLAIFNSCRYHNDRTLHMMYGKDEVRSCDRMHSLQLAWARPYERWGVGGGEFPIP